mgnify:FL=1|tara:strand:+ start:377 stop:565 length:189 start_codon:yes stop_codon:yes gene_type:complete
MSQPSVILLLCLSPIVVVFVVIKLAIWLSETAKYNAETDKLKRMQHGPYIVWDDEEDEDDNY